MIFGIFEAQKCLKNPRFTPAVWGKKFLPNFT
jgi:hypothetical protein